MSKKLFLIIVLIKCMFVNAEESQDSTTRIEVGNYRYTKYVHVGNPSIMPVDKGYLFSVDMGDGELNISDLEDLLLLMDKIVEPWFKVAMLDSKKSTGVCQVVVNDKNYGSILMAWMNEKIYRGDRSFFPDYLIDSGYKEFLEHFYVSILNDAIFNSYCEYLNTKNIEKAKRGFFNYLDHYKVEVDRVLG